MGNPECDNVLRLIRFNIFNGNFSLTFSLFISQHWEVFQSIPELFILVPALLGLKGNLDMTLASRLSTQANLGNMQSAKEVVHMIVGNIALVQVQATVAAFIVSVFSMGVGAVLNGSFNIDHAFLLTASSMFTATSSCFVLGEFCNLHRDFDKLSTVIRKLASKQNSTLQSSPLKAKQFSESIDAFVK